jgi:anthranilate phosphoribosyltransferase
VVTPQEERLYTLREFGLTPASAASLSGGATVEEAAAIFDRVLAGTALEEQTRCVLFNAAFAIRLLNPSLCLADALDAAQESIDSGAALRCFTKFLQLNS